MTVQQLINKLEKMPKSLQIYIADHDHGKYETNNTADTCELIDKKEMNEYHNDKYNCHGSFPFTHTPKKYIVIRP